MVDGRKGMWWMPGREFGRQKRYSKTLNDGKNERGHCTAGNTVLVAPPAMVKDKRGEGCQTVVGQVPIN